MHRRVTALCLSVTALFALAVPATAPAKAKKKAKAPTITKVTPMRLRVGSTVVIRGRNFSSRRTRNTVVFRSSSGRSAFVKPKRASRTKLVARVPASVGRLISGGSERFKLRVLSAGKFSRFTSKRLSPVLVSGRRSGGGSGPLDGASPCTGADLDGDDLLPAALENQIGTDACLKDTDGDGMTDGWEYYAAKDLNIKAVPYPGKRPFPNALDPSDTAFDFDGDGLTASEEFRAWRFTGSSFDPAKVGGTDLESPLGYSDGTKYSRASTVPAAPAWRSASYGMTPPTQAFPATYNLHGDGSWRDDERDADRDGLSNFLEANRGPRTNAWQRSFWASPGRFSPTVEAWKVKAYCGYRPGHFDERPFADFDIDDPDVDGDTLLDGEDDQDNDDVNNITELYEVMYDLDGNGNPLFCGWGAGVVPSISFGGTTAPVNAMNPCVPDPDSRTCNDYIPF